MGSSFLPLDNSQQVLAHGFGGALAEHQVKTHFAVFEARSAGNGRGVNYRGHRFHRGMLQPPASQSLRIVDPVIKVDQRMGGILVLQHLLDGLLETHEGSKGCHQ